MKLKKIFAAIAAAAVAGATSLTCLAVSDGDAAYCFDTNSRISDWQAYGTVDETGFAFAQTVKQSKNGEGSLLVSENISAESDDYYGGAFITAESLGLPNFGGCTITMSVLLADGAEENCENLALYSDGIIYLESRAENLSSKTWTDITLEIPEDASNTKAGFTLPTLKAYSGELVYIDDFSVVKADGTAVSNLGDYKMKTITSEDTVPSWVNIILVVVLVVLIVIIIGGIGILVSNGMKKFH